MTDRFFANRAPEGGRLARPYSKNERDFNELAPLVTAHSAMNARIRRLCCRLVTKWGCMAALAGSLTNSVEESASPFKRHLKRALWRRGGSEPSSVMQGLGPSPRGELCRCSRSRGESPRVEEQRGATSRPNGGSP